ncbi:MAG: glycosyltransferase family 39 protein [Candidatus Nitrosopelagicus sp.]|nr:glycosyltransferase family 39 protein [Candidatus Nitrosopelagicus sp.]
MAVSYTGFVHHNYWIQDQDGIHFLNGGNQVISGDGKNVHFSDLPISGPIFFASLNTEFQDGFTLMKLSSIISGSASVLLVFFIIRNVFDYRTAIIGQLLFAISPWFSYFSFQAEPETLFTFFILVSMYFITKKDLRYNHLILVGVAVGLSFLVRYQSVVVLIAMCIFLLFHTKKIQINLAHVALVLVFFLIVISPLLIYNYSQFGNPLLINSNFYMQFSAHYQNPEWKEQVYRFAMEDKGTVDAIFLDFELFQKNYFYNLVYNTPNKLFNFFDITNTSLIPAIPLIGMIPVIGGLLYVMKINITKINLTIILATASITTAIVLLFGDSGIHFFAIISIPLFILGVVNIKKIQSNLLPLLILLVLFPIITSIVRLNAAEQFFVIWLPIIILSAVFFSKTIPIIFNKIRGDKEQHNKQLLIIIFFMICMIFLANVGYEYVLVRATSSGIPFVSISEEIKNFPMKGDLEKIGKEVEEIGNILSKQNGIENSNILANQFYYSHYFPANYVMGQFHEGPENDTIENYISRENWKEIEIYHSNVHSIPLLKENTSNLRIDYLIFELRQSDKSKNQHEYLQVLSDPSNPLVPPNFEVLYFSDSPRNIVVYKINYND